MVTLLGGDGNDIIKAGTAIGQYVGSVSLSGGSGNDVIETGHVEGAIAASDGIDGGAGNDTIRVKDTLNGVGIFGNATFKIAGGDGADVIDLQGTQINTAGAAISIVDGGAGFDSLVWNTSYDLNQNTNQTGVDSSGSAFAHAIGVRNLDRLDIAKSGVVGVNVALSAADVTAITAGSDFNRAALPGLGLTGTGNTLFVNLGDASNNLNLTGSWKYLGDSVVGGNTYRALLQGTSTVLVNGDTTTAGGAVMKSQNEGTVVAASLNAEAGALIDGGAGDDLLTLAGSNAYTQKAVTLIGGDGNDTLRAATGAGQYAGSIVLSGGAGDDRIETGHIEGALAAGSGLYCGAGNDTIRVLDTLNGTGIFGNTAFSIFGGDGYDTIDLSGTQFNTRGDAINVIDGGADFDTFIWNASYDLNRNTNQTGVDSIGSIYPSEIGARNIELLDIAKSGVLGANIRLGASDVAAITSGSDFNRANLTGLGLTGTGNTLFVNMGDPSNHLSLTGTWSYLGDTNHDSISYKAYQQGSAFLLES